MREKKNPDVISYGVGEYHNIQDYHIRSRAKWLYVRKRKWLDKATTGICPNPLARNSTKVGVDFKKREIDTTPVSISTLRERNGLKGKTLRKQYKEKLSSLRSWTQLGHADEYILFEENLGSNMSLDET